MSLYHLYFYSKLSSKLKALNFSPLFIIESENDRSSIFHIWPKQDVRPKKDLAFSRIPKPKPYELSMML